MLVKTLGISKLVFVASVLCVSEMVIKTVQEKLLKFLWKNKKDKVKRSVLYQPHSHGGLNFPNFHTVIKSLCLSWLGRFLNGANESWQAIPNDFFNRYGGLSFLLKCNYDSKKLDENLPLYYREMFDYFKELRAGHPDIDKSEFILWNIKESTIIENKSMFWAHLSEQGICFVHDLLDKNGKFLSLENVQCKCNVHLNFFQYFQLIAAIPSYLKKKAQETAVTNRNILNERDVFYLSKNKALFNQTEVQRLLLTIYFRKTM